MRMIERPVQFKRDYKRVKATPQYGKDSDNLLTDVLKLLLEDKILLVKNRDHALNGNWEGYRECHIKPDLLLIYRKPDKNTLRLPRIGSHSQLFS